MIRSTLNAVRRIAARSSRGYTALAVAPALLLLGGSPAATAAPPSPIVLEHLVAQAGFSIGFSTDLILQFLVVSQVNNLGDCQPAFSGGNGTLSAEFGHNSMLLGMMNVYYDAACTLPFFTENLVLVVQNGEIFATTGQYLAPNGAILGVLSQAQEVHGFNSSLSLTGKGTYKAVAGTGQPPIRTAFACIMTTDPVTYAFVCQEGMAQDFPALKLSLGSIVHMNLTLTKVASNQYSASISGSTAKLVTGKLGNLSVTTTSPTTVGFQGPATTVDGGTTSGSSPNIGMGATADTTWAFHDSHDIKFSASTGFNADSSGTVTNPLTHGSASFNVDPSGTGTITYSDKSKAKITNWTLSD